MGSCLKLNTGLAHVTFQQRNRRSLRFIYFSFDLQLPFVVTRQVKSVFLLFHMTVWAPSGNLD